MIIYNLPPKFMILVDKVALKFYENQYTALNVDQETPAKPTLPTQKGNVNVR
jgi:hypothetical protein